MGGWKIGLFLLPVVNFYFWFKRGDEGENEFGAPRPTTTVEKVIAFISIILGVVAVIALVAVMVFLGQNGLGGF
jgi:hypothetical protein